MQIQYYGYSCFKITTKPEGRATDEITIFTDPFDKSVGLRPPQGHADVVFISHDHPGHNNHEALKGDPVIIQTPGEFAVKGINALGINSFHDGKEGINLGRNTIYIFESEGLKICHMGDLGHMPTSKQWEHLTDIDILFIPVGAKKTIDGTQAAEIAKKIEPKVIIPMHFKIKGMNDDIDDEKNFCSQIGNCPDEKVNKIVIKEKEIAEKVNEVILMNEV